MVSVPYPSKTLLLVLFIGVTFAAVPFLVAADDGSEGRTYEATAFDPESEANVLAHRANDVTNLTTHSDENRTRRILERAAAGESVTVDANESTLAYLSHDTGYAVYRGDYYYVNATESDGTVTIRLDARTADEAMADLAVPYESASPAVQRVVDRGNGTIRSGEVGNGTLWADVPPVVERDGTYYVVGLASILEVLAPFVELFVLTVFKRIGNVYLGVGLGILGATAVVGRRRALGLRSATAVAGFAALVHGALSVSLRSTGNPLAMVMSVPTGFALAAVLGVGVAIRSPRSARRLLAASGIVFGAIIASGATAAVTTGSVIPLLTTGIWETLFVLGVGLPLLGLGYVHADGRQRNPSADGQTAEMESIEDAFR